MRSRPIPRVILGVPPSGPPAQAAAGGRSGPAESAGNAEPAGRPADMTTGPDVQPEESASTGSTFTLAATARRLGETLLDFAAPLPVPARDITGVWLAETDAQLLLRAGTLVLAPGARTSDETSLLMTAALKAEAAGVVFGARANVDAQRCQDAVDAGLAVITLAPGASWLQLASVLQTLAGGHSDVPADDYREGQSTDLFDVANSVAAILGGPATIENMDSRILAFSADQAAGDEIRKQSVLGHQVPYEYAQQLRQLGVFRAVNDSDEPVFLPSLGPGVLPRVGMRVRAGNQNLGSIWVVVDEPPNAHRNRTLMEAADIVALSMLRTRTAADAAARLRYGLLVMLLEGGAAAEETAARIGFGGQAAVVMAAGLRHSDAHAAETDTEAETEAELERLANAVGLHLHAANALSVVARLGGHVYAVFPVGRKSGGEQSARRVAGEVAARLHSSQVVVGLGPVVASAGRLNRSRVGADSALRVLLSRRGSEKSAMVASGDEVQVEALMLALRDSLVAGRERPAGPLALLIAHDVAHGGDLVATLTLWLDFFGDVAAASAALHVHQNTFRYRLRKLCEVARIDLSDPEERFALMLQLRLFEVPSKNS